MKRGYRLGWTKNAVFGHKICQLGAKLYFYDAKPNSFISKFFPNMGKGDKRSKKGKIWRGSYGNSRPNQKQQDKKKIEKKKNE
jgi:30S ribosomal protein S31